MICSDCTGSCQSKYHTITTKTAPAVEGIFWCSKIWYNVTSLKDTSDIRYIPVLWSKVQQCYVYGEYATLLVSIRQFKNTHNSSRLPIVMKTFPTPPTTRSSSIYLWHFIHCHIPVTPLYIHVFLTVNLSEILVI